MSDAAKDLAAAHLDLVDRAALAVVESGVPTDDLWIAYCPSTGVTQVVSSPGRDPESTRRQVHATVEIEFDAERRAIDLKYTGPPMRAP